jgi:hypothetical protein
MEQAYKDHFLMGIETPQELRLSWDYLTPEQRKKLHDLIKKLFNIMAKQKLFNIMAKQKLQTA